MRDTKTKRLTILGNRTTLTASPWFKPYITVNGRRRTALREYTGGAVAGVYLIRNSRTKEVLYIGFSYSNLIKTLYRHFQSWSENNHTHATYSPTGPYQIRFMIGMDGSQAAALEQQMIQRHQPRDNGHKYMPKGYQPQTAQADAVDEWLRNDDRFAF